MTRFGTVISLYVLIGTACAVAPAASDDRMAADSLSVLTLNLHTYQEVQTDGVAESELTDAHAAARVANYADIFDRIAAGINDLDADIVCLQEVGEWAGARRGDPMSIRYGESDSNMALQIRGRLDDEYFVSMDWSHFGFLVWLEGSAILSKHPIVGEDSRYISRPENSHVDTWKSRNVPMATIRVPGRGDVDVLSVHTGWWDDDEEPFREQFTRLLDWVGDTQEAGSTTVLCGDFNVAAGGPGYDFMTDGSGFADQFARANADDFYAPTIGPAIDGWEASTDAQRIDYILMNDDSPWRVAEASIVFTATDYGVVSDHAGVFVRLVPKSD